MDRLTLQLQKVYIEILNLDFDHRLHIASVLIVYFTDTSKSIWPGEFYGPSCGCINCWACFRTPFSPGPPSKQSAFMSLNIGIGIGFPSVEEPKEASQALGFILHAGSQKMQEFVLYCGEESPTFLR